MLFRSLLLWMTEMFVRAWLRDRSGEIGPPPRPSQVPAPDGTSQKAMLTAEAAAVHQLLSGQIDATTYHYRMHELACRDELTRGAPS